MSDDMNYVEHLAQDAPTVMIEYYCIVASSALLWFDHILTFPSEYSRIWRRKFTGATFIFLLMRYAAFIERIFFVLEVLVWDASDKTCNRITHVDDILLFISYLAIAAFAALRVYSVWGRVSKPLLLAGPISLINCVLVMYENARYISIQDGPPFGCVYFYRLSDTTLARLSTATNVASLAAASILIVVTWVKTFSIVSYSFRGGLRTPLASILMQDGTLYILAIFVFQLPPMLPIHVASWPSAWLFFGEVFVVIAHSRFMLSLRGLYFADGGAGESELTPHWSGINFHGISSRIVGNLGATLDLSPGSGLGAGHEVSPGAMWQDASDREFESEWADEVPEYCDDPFSAGLMSVRVGMADVVERVAQEITLDGSQLDGSAGEGPCSSQPSDGTANSLC